MFMGILTFVWREEAGIIRVGLNLDLTATLVVTKPRVFFDIFVSVPVLHGGHPANVLEEMPGEYIV